MDHVSVLERWDYADPRGTEASFRKLLSECAAQGDVALCALVQTQLARTFSLRGEFERAHALLGQIELDLTEQHSIQGVYWHLEKGRTWNSSGERDVALKHFQVAFDRAVELMLEAEAIDAAHMIAIALGEDEGALSWNERALGMAAEASCPRARRWRASLSNNLGWTLATRGEYTRALEAFEIALLAREEQGGEEAIRIAKYAVGHALRKLGRVAEARAIQQDLVNQCDAIAKPSGYFVEELAECLLEEGEQRASILFARAFELLSQDDWIAANEPERLERLRALSA